MTTIARVEKAAATLAAIWGVSPAEVALRLKIAIDLAHVEALRLGARAERARRSVNKAYETKRTLKRSHRSTVEATMRMLEDEKLFKQLRKELTLFVRARLNLNRLEIEEIVSEALFRVCFYECASQRELFAIAKNLARKILVSFLYNKHVSGISEISSQNLEYLEQTLAYTDEEEHSDEAELALTSCPETALRRLGAELVRLLGAKQAAVACGMREKTFMPFLAAA